VAISIDFATKVITVPKADLTLVSGTLFELPTETKFRADVNALMDDEIGIVFDDPISHTTETTIVGTTFARFIELINGYSITFENLAYSVRMIESNNNLFDVDGGILNASGNVTVVGQNSAGLISVTSGSGVTQQDKDDIEAQIFAHIYEGTESFQGYLRLARAYAAGDIAQLPDGTYKIKSIDGAKDRIEGDDTANSGRDVTATDVT